MSSRCPRKTRDRGTGCSRSPSGTRGCPDHLPRPCGSVACVEVCCAIARRFALARYRLRPARALQVPSAPLALPSDPRRRWWARCEGGAAMGPRGAPCPRESTTTGCPCRVSGPSLPPLAPARSSATLVSATDLSQSRTIRSDFPYFRIRANGQVVKCYVDFSSTVSDLLACCVDVNCQVRESGVRTRWPRSPQ